MFHELLGLLPILFLGNNGLEFVAEIKLCHWWQVAVNQERGQVVDTSARNIAWIYFCGDFFFSLIFVILVNVVVSTKKICRNNWTFVLMHVWMTDWHCCSITEAKYLGSRQSWSTTQIIRKGTQGKAISNFGTYILLLYASI